MEVNGVRAGQYVRVTSLQASRGWRGQHLITIPAGAEYDGVVQNLTADGFFDLRRENGTLQSWSAYDTSISVTPL